jgi:hypothetical protein
MTSPLPPVIVIDVDNHVTAVAGRGVSEARSPGNSLLAGKKIRYCHYFSIQFPVDVLEERVNT